MGGPLPSTANCTTYFIEQPLDHFSWPTGTGTYKQRYYVYDRWWKKAEGPVFFYVGACMSSEWKCVGGGGGGRRGRGQGGR